MRMKRTLAWLLAVSMLLSQLPLSALSAGVIVDITDPTTDVTILAEVSLPGRGTEADPYQITDLDGLQRLRDFLQVGMTFDGCWFVLTSDLDLSELCGGDKGSWTPIGYDDAHYFGGNLDGAGHTVSGLYIDTAADDQGFFDITRGTIKNLTVSGTVTGDNEAGGIVGNSSGRLENCAFSGTVTGVDDVGGAAGRSAGTIVGCSFNGTVSGDDYVGVVVGMLQLSTLSDCAHAGAVNGGDTKEIGGIVGEPFSAVTGCGNSGTVSGNTQVGGIAGLLSAGVARCRSSGVVRGRENVGGIAGSEGSSRATIEGCTNAGEVGGAVRLCLYCMKTQVFNDGNKRAAVIFANHCMIGRAAGLLVIPEKDVPEFKRLLVRYYEDRGEGGIAAFMREKCWRKMQ